MRKIAKVVLDFHGHGLEDHRDGIFDDLFQLMGGLDGVWATIFCSELPGPERGERYFLLFEAGDHSPEAVFKIVEEGIALMAESEGPNWVSQVNFEPVDESFAEEVLRSASGVPAIRPKSDLHYVGQWQVW